MEFKSLKNIETSFKQIRLFTLVVVCLCALLAGYSVQPQGAGVFLRLAWSYGFGPAPRAVVRSPGPGNRLTALPGPFFSGRAVAVQARKQEVHAKIGEEHGHKAKKRHPGQKTAAFSARKTGVQGESVEKPGDERPGLLGIPVPVGAPGLVGPDRTADSTC